MGCSTLLLGNLRVGCIHLHKILAYPAFSTFLGKTGYKLFNFL